MAVSSDIYINYLNVLGGGGTERKKAGKQKGRAVGGGGGKQRRMTGTSIGRLVRGR